MLDCSLGGVGVRGVRETVGVAIEQGGGAEDELDNEEQTDEHITDEGETEAGGWLVDDSEEKEILCLCRR